MDGEHDMEGLVSKIKKDSALKDVLIQSWMFVLGIFWLFRFWSLKAETMWLIKLNCYQGDETVRLVKVCLGKEGMVCLGGSLLLLILYANKVMGYLKNNNLSRESMEQSDSIVPKI